MKRERDATDASAEVHKNLRTSTLEDDVKSLEYDIRSEYTNMLGAVKEEELNICTLTVRVPPEHRSAPEIDWEQHHAHAETREKEELIMKEYCAKAAEYLNDPDEYFGKSPEALMTDLEDLFNTKDPNKLNNSINLFHAAMSSVIDDDELNETLNLDLTSANEFAEYVELIILKLKVGLLREHFFDHSLNIKPAPCPSHSFAEQVSKNLLLGRDC